jgi:hypothetical protein
MKIFFFQGNFEFYLVFLRNQKDPKETAEIAD